MKLPEIVLALVLLASAADADEQCALHQVGSLEMIQQPNGRVAVPIMLAGKQQLVTIDFSAPLSYLDASYVDAEGFDTKKLPEGVGVNVQGTPATKVAVVPEVQIGSAGGKYVEFVRAEGKHRKGDDTVGELALDKLSGFDVELEFKEGKVNLFSQDHCQGEVVYWANTYAALPFVTDKSGHTNFKMVLDGKDVSVSFDLAPLPGRMGILAAKRIFDLDMDSPGMTLVSGPPEGARPLYTYPFKSLGVQGISISNPTIYLYWQDRECTQRLTVKDDKWFRCYGASDVILGLKEMVQLHFYFAFKEKVLYVTSADAHK